MADAQESTRPQLPEEPAGLFFGLSARLLWLTIAFVMLCEVFIFAPSIARFRVQYLEMKLDAAHLTLTALEAAEMVDPDLQRRLLIRRVFLV